LARPVGTARRRGSPSVRCQIAHGDLSAYNVLVDGGRLVLIDLQQLVDVVANPRGPEFLATTAASRHWLAARDPPTSDAAKLTGTLPQGGRHPLSSRRSLRSRALRLLRETSSSSLAPREPALGLASASGVFKSTRPPQRALGASGKRCSRGGLDGMVNCPGAGGGWWYRGGPGAGRAGGGGWQGWSGSTQGQGCPPWPAVGQDPRTGRSPARRGGFSRRTVPRWRVSPVVPVTPLPEHPVARADGSAYRDLYTDAGTRSSDRAESPRPVPADDHAGGTPRFGGGAPPLSAELGNGRACTSRGGNKKSSPRLGHGDRRARLSELRNAQVRQFPPHRAAATAGSPTGLAAAGTTPDGLQVDSVPVSLGSDRHGGPRFARTGERRQTAGTPHRVRCRDGARRVTSDANGVAWREEPPE